jgi:hypothetical protein
MENWTPINNYPNYAVSKDGQIKSIRFDRILKPSFNDSGYGYVNLSNNGLHKSTAIHKIVIEHFKGSQPVENYVVDHKDGNKKNNHIDNLEWVSIKENTLRAYGNQDKKIKILELREQGYTLQQIANEVGMSLYTVQQTCKKGM